MALELYNKCEAISSCFNDLAAQVQSISVTVEQLSEAFSKFALPNYGVGAEDYFDYLMNYINACHTDVLTLEDRITTLELKGNKNGTIY